jgi:hypothetical protein
MRRITMKGKRRNFTGIVVALSMTVMVAFAGVALAGGGEGCGGPGGPGEHGGPGGHPNIRMLAKKLALTN